MTAIALLSSVLPPSEPPEPPVAGVCCVLGTVEPTIARGHVVKESFTNHDLLRAPSSDRVSVTAWRVLTHRTPAKAGKKRDGFPLMQSSWFVCAAGIRYCTRQEIRSLVLAGIEAPRWAGYVTTSYKKHGALRAPVNTGRAARWLFETTIVDASDAARVADWWHVLSETRAAGIPRGCIETLDISVPLLAKHAARWPVFERWARSSWQAPLYRFLTYLLPSEEEIKADTWR